MTMFADYLLISLNAVWIKNLSYGNDIFSNSDLKCTVSDSFLYDVMTLRNVWTFT